MGRYVLQRLLLVVPTAALAVSIVFLATNVLPGDVSTTIAGDHATAEVVADIRERLGLDRPVLVQFADWAGGVVRGDLGDSLLSGAPVVELLGNRLPITMSLAGGALFLALVIAVPLGIAAALNVGRWPDRLVSLIASAGMASPPFFLGLMLVLVFALELDVFPATGYVEPSEDVGLWLEHIFLPSLALSFPLAAELARQLRASLVDTFFRDYIRTAHAYGYSRRRIVAKHALRNAALPVVTVLGSQIVNLLGGVIAIEQVFGIPGIGSLVFEAVLQRDLPTIQGVAVLAAFSAILVNLAVDVSYAVLNPRLRKASA
jgi:peptide/nickel transport system permease protein